MDFGALAVSGAFLFDAIGWILFARSQSDRRQGRVLAWMALPRVVGGIVYLLAAIIIPPITDMRIYARLGFIVVGISTGLVLLLLCVVQRGRDGRSE